EPVGRPAAAPLHRAHGRGETGSDPVRRAMLGARSDLDRQDRGADRRTETGLHDRDRDPQHAAGGARVGLHGFHVSRRIDRVRLDHPHVHLAGRSPHPGLHHRPLRLMSALGNTRQRLMVDQHTAKAFDVDLQDLARMVAEMGGLAEKQIADAIDALAKRDGRLAQRVVGLDPTIDALQREIEERAILTIARRQPMAVDLREIVGALRVSNDLERIGDLAKNIAKRVIALGTPTYPSQVIRGVEHMAELVLAQLKDVLDAYARQDVTKALAVWRGDEEIDAVNNSLFRQVLTYMMEDPRNITFCTHLLFCAKNIERMGDHATNIAETVYYIAEGRALTDERPKGDSTSSTNVPYVSS